MAGIIYNVTVKIDPDVEETWLHWMRETHIPDVLQTGCFTGCTIRKLKYPLDTDGVTYTFQYRCAGMHDLDRYHREHASALQQDHSSKFADRFVAFRTVLEDVENFDNGS